MTVLTTEALFVFSIIMLISIVILAVTLKRTRNKLDAVGTLAQTGNKKLGFVKEMLQTVIKGNMDHSKRLEALENNQKILMEINSEVFAINVRSGKVLQFKNQKYLDKKLEEEIATWHQVDKLPDEKCKDCHGRGHNGRILTKGNLYRACSCLTLPDK